MRLQKTLLERKLVWLDGHRGNIFFRKINGQWEAGVLDQDFITRWGNWNQRRVAERMTSYEFAPGQFGMRSYNGHFDSSMLAHPELRSFKTQEELAMRLLEYDGWIAWQGGPGGSFVSRGVDIELMPLWPLRHFPTIFSKSKFLDFYRADKPNVLPQ